MSRGGLPGEVSAGRVIAGTARSVRLVGPGEGTRPLGDRLKQSLFAILEPRLRDHVFVDLYAGSGAAGIEALSRGAAFAVFVEQDGDAIAVIRRNLEATGLDDRAVVVHESASIWLVTAARRELAARPAMAVFLDPPYDSPVELDWTLEAIATSGPGKVLAKDGWAIAKHFWKVELPPQIGLLRSIRQARFGETMLTFYRWSGEDPA